MNNEKPFGWKDKIGYGLGDFGCNMSFAFINSYMMLFFVTCLGIDPKHYAIIIMLAKIWDGINDPIIGCLFQVLLCSFIFRMRPTLLKSHSVL